MTTEGASWRWLLAVPESAEERAVTLWLVGGCVGPVPATPADLELERHEARLLSALSPEELEKHLTQKEDA